MFRPASPAWSRKTLGGTPASSVERLLKLPGEEQPNAWAHGRVSAQQQ